VLATSVSPSRVPEKSIPDLKRKWQLYGPDDLGARVAQIGGGEYIVGGLIAERSLNIVVGESGHGKTPFLYQLGLCVASGTPFLGRPVKQGRVLYMDYENGLGELDEMLARLKKHLNLVISPADFLCFNINDCAPSWLKNGYGLVDLIKDVHPVLTIIDPLGSPFPKAEEKNDAANQLYTTLRGVMRKERTSIMLVHHLRKPSEERGGARLEDGNIRDFFKQARGASSLITGVDLRLGVDLPKGHSSGGSEVALVVGGYGRVRGDIPIIRLGRAYGDDGEPLGYVEVTGVALLNAEQQEAFGKLPSTMFRHKDAKLVYGKGPQATTDFLNKCISCGILTKANGLYQKITIQETDQTISNNPLQSNTLLVQ